MKIIHVETECKEDPDRWFSSDPKILEEVMDICDRCPFKVACKETAINTNETWGVWGGTDFGNSNSSIISQNTVLGVCRNGKHPKNGPGPCVPCRKDSQKRYEDNRQRPNKPRGTYPSRHKNILGGKCSKNHELTKETSTVRNHDGAVLCNICTTKARAYKPVVLPAGVRNNR